MIRLWGPIIRPMVDAIHGRNILEIGAEYGRSTHVLLNYVRDVGGHLHCIDPAPVFDVEDFKRANADVMTFYQDLSLEVLPGITGIDVALVDGDHNWYTVYNELKAIEASHGHDPLKQPLLFCHDIGWPYGRRDLYYNPANIPAQYRHAYALKGILPRKEELVEGAGMNLDMYNAEQFGGERNGVLTGVEDYLAQSALEYRFLNLPLFYGLGILITEQRLAGNAELQSQVQRLEHALQGEELIALAEHMRLVEGLVLQGLSRQLQESQQQVEALQAELAALRQVD